MQAHYFQYYTTRSTKVSVAMGGVWKIPFTHRAVEVNEEEHNYASSFVGSSLIVCFDRVTHGNQP